MGMVNLAQISQKNTIKMHSRAIKYKQIGLTSWLVLEMGAIILGPGTCGTFQSFLVISADVPCIGTKLMQNIWGGVGKFGQN